MKNSLLPILFGIGIFLNLNAQSNLTVDQSYTVEEMVTDFFNHPDIIISNISYTGDEAAYGFFDSGDPSETALEVNAGIIISTGDVTNAIGPNMQDGISTSFNGDSDPDLDSLLGTGGGMVNDAAVISFDLTVSNTLELEFSYVFGSEEYCEFTGSTFNDVFGFFVSGPGISGPFINGGVNIATIPGSTNSDFVSINNINQNLNSNLFIPNSENDFGTACGGAIDPENIEYDGFSVALNASFTAVAGETYHIRLALADVSDYIFDTGLFLGFNSLSMDSLLTPPAQFSASNIITNGAEFTNESKYATSFLWDFGNGMTSTEKNPGVIDYANAGTYEVSLTTQNYCCTDVYTQMVTVEEVGLTSIVSTSNNPLQCPGDSNASFDLEIEGGTPPYDIEWDQQNVDPENLAAGFYLYTITDQSGQTLSGQFEIMSPDDFSGVFNTIPDIDQQGNGSLEIIVEGGTSPYTYLWSNGETTAFIENLEAGPYTVTVVDNNGCTSEFTGSVDALVSAITVTTTTTNNPLLCPGLSNAMIELDLTGGMEPYDIVWTPSTDDLTNLSAGIYAFTVTDQLGTESTFEVEIEEPEALVLDITTVTDETNDDMDGTASISASGGTAPYSYLWSDGSTLAERNDLSAGDYSVTVTDDNGCTVQISLSINQIMVSTQNPNNSFTFEIFPNPASDRIFVSWSRSEKVELVRVYDVLGKKMAIDYSLKGTELEVRWDRMLAAGVYYLEIQMENGKRGVERFVVE